MKGRNSHLLQEGVLPDDMMPDHNDLGFSSDSEEDLPFDASHGDNGEQPAEFRVNKRLLGTPCTILFADSYPT